MHGRTPTPPDPNRPTPPTDVEDLARDRLRAAGLRATRPRTLVYAVLREVRGHRSVDDVLHLLRDRGHAISRMTVYNVVADLTAASLLMHADAGPGPALFEAGDVWHHHFVCRDCGRIDDVPCVQGRKPCLRPPDMPPGATVDEAQVIFRGRCPDCAARESNAKRA